MNIDTRNIKVFLRNGQSLIETVIAIAVVVLIVSGLVIAVISSMRSAQSSRARSLATKLTQDGIESIRNLRDSGWANFIDSYTSFDEWCLGTDGIPSPPDCTDITISNLHFTRTALIENSGQDQVTVTVRVTWKDGSTTDRQSKASTYLTKWR